MGYRNAVLLRVGRGEPLRVTDLGEAAFGHRLVPLQLAHCLIYKWRIAHDRGLAEELSGRRPVLEQGCGDVALPGVGQDDDDDLVGARWPSGYAQGRMQRRAG